MDDPIPMIWSLDKDGIQGAVSSRLGAIKECYSGWKKAAPDLSGRLEVQFTIGPKTDEDDTAGVVGAAVLDTELDHVWVEGCVLNSLQDLVFEQPEQGTISVTYPFVFSGKADDEP